MQRIVRKQIQDEAVSLEKIEKLNDGYIIIGTEGGNIQVPMGNATGGNILDWVQDNEYKLHELVSHNGGIWRSKVDDNLTEPVKPGGDSGWEVVPSIEVDYIFLGIGITENPLPNITAIEGTFNFTDDDGASNYLMPVTVPIGSRILLVDTEDRGQILFTSSRLYEQGERYEIYEADEPSQGIKKIFAPYDLFDNVPCDVVITMYDIHTYTEDTLYRLISCPYTDLPTQQQEESMWDLLAEINDNTTRVLTVSVEDLGLTGFEDDETIREALAQYLEDKNINGNEIWYFNITGIKNGLSDESGYGNLVNTIYEFTLEEIGAEDWNDDVDEKLANYISNQNIEILDGQSVYFKVIGNDDGDGDDGGDSDDDDSQIYPLGDIIPDYIYGDIYKKGSLVRYGRSIWRSDIDGNSVEPFDGGAINSSWGLWNGIKPNKILIYEPHIDFYNLNIDILSDAEVFYFNDVSDIGGPTTFNTPIELSAGEVIMFPLINDQEGGMYAFIYKNIPIDYQVGDQIFDIFEFMTSKVDSYFIFEEYLSELMTQNGLCEIMSGYGFTIMSSNSSGTFKFNNCPLMNLPLDASLLKSSWVKLGEKTTIPNYDINKNHKAGDIVFIDDKIWRNEIDDNNVVPINIKEGWERYHDYKKLDYLVISSDIIDDENGIINMLFSNPNLFGGVTRVNTDKILGVNHYIESGSTVGVIISGDLSHLIYDSPSGSGLMEGLCLIIDDFPDDIYEGSTYFHEPHQILSNQTDNLSFFIPNIVFGILVGNYDSYEANNFINYMDNSEVKLLTDSYNDIYLYLKDKEYFNILNPNNGWTKLNPDSDVKWGEIVGDKKEVNLLGFSDGHKDLIEFKKLNIPDIGGDFEKCVIIDNYFVLLFSENYGLQTFHYDQMTHGNEMLNPIKRTHLDDDENIIITGIDHVSDSHQGDFCAIFLENTQTSERFFLRVHSPYDDFTSNNIQLLPGLTSDILFSYFHDNILYVETFDFNNKTYILNDYTNEFELLTTFRNRLNGGTLFKSITNHKTNITCVVGYGNGINYTVDGINWSGGSLPYDENWNYILDVIINPFNDEEFLFLYGSGDIYATKDFTDLELRFTNYDPNFKYRVILPLGDSILLLGVIYDGPTFENVASGIKVLQLDNNLIEISNGYDVDVKFYFKDLLKFYRMPNFGNTLSPIPYIKKHERHDDTNINTNYTFFNVVIDDNGDKTNTEITIKSSVRFKNVINKVSVDDNSKTIIDGLLDIDIVPELNDFNVNNKPNKLFWNEDGLWLRQKHQLDLLRSLNLNGWVPTPTTSRWVYDEYLSTINKDTIASFDMHLDVDDNIDYIYSGENEIPTNQVTLFVNSLDFDFTHPDVNSSGVLVINNLEAINPGDNLMEVVADRLVFINNNYSRFNTDGYSLDQLALLHDGDVYLSTHLPINEFFEPSWKLISSPNKVIHHNHEEDTNNKWVDGKTIYRRTIIIDCGEFSGNLIPLSGFIFGEIDTICPNTTLFIDWTTNNNKKFFGFVSPNEVMLTLTTENLIAYNIDGETPFNVNEFDTIALTIEYTKK